MSLTRSEAQALIDLHQGDGRVLCQCLQCIWAREVLAQWDALDAAKDLERHAVGVFAPCGLHFS